MPAGIRRGHRPQPRAHRRRRDRPRLTTLEKGPSMTAPARNAGVTETSATRPLLGITEAAEYLGVSERWLYDQVRSGQLPAMYIARSWKIRPDALDEFADSFSARTTANVRPRAQVRRLS